MLFRMKQWLALLTPALSSSQGGEGDETGADWVPSPPCRGERGRDSLGERCAMSV